MYMDVNLPMTLIYDARIYHPRDVQKLRQKISVVLSPMMIPNLMQSHGYDVTENVLAFEQAKRC